MNNPFDKDQVLYESGFYFDRTHKCIVFYHLKESFLRLPKIYSRLYPNVESRFILHSEHNDLVMLEFEHVQNNIDEFILDVEWLGTNKQLINQFEEYLIEDEQYELLACLDETINKLKSK